MREKKCKINGFTLVEVLVAMLIFVGAVVMLVGAFISAQRAIIFAKHKQQAVFILQERIEQVKYSNWGTMAGEGIILNVMGTVTKSIEAIEYETSPGTTTTTIAKANLPINDPVWEINLLSGIVTTATTTEATPYRLLLEVETLTTTIIGGRFLFISTWMEEGRKVDVSLPVYLAWHPEGI
jgi:type II secretory pathway pseudopilin PulG